jgi:diacylglycerol kinase (ATP)
VVAGGGDGTVVWVIEEMVKFGCDFEQTPIGIIAYGTGNDFSRVTGWGGGDPGSLTAGNLKGLKNMIKRWLNALIEDFDIWDIKISTYEKDGAFKKICVGQNKQVQKVIMKDH